MRCSFPDCAEDGCTHSPATCPGDAVIRERVTPSQILGDFPEDDGIDWYALSNGLGTVMPDGTRIEPED